MYVNNMGFEHFEVVSDLSHAAQQLRNLPNRLRVKRASQDCNHQQGLVRA